MKNRILRQVSIILAALMICMSFAACGGNDTEKDGDAGQKKAAINVISREEGSGTRGAFVELFGIEEKDAEMKKFKELIASEFAFISYAPVVFLSALTKKRIHTLMPEVLRVYENSKKEIKTSVLNDVIRDAYELNLPPSYKGKRLKIYFASQASIKPPVFNLQVNNKGLVHFSYKRYLENKIRESFDFTGVPIVLQFKNKGEEEI